MVLTLPNQAHTQPRSLRNSGRAPNDDVSATMARRPAATADTAAPAKPATLATEALTTTKRTATPPAVVAALWFKSPPASCQAHAPDAVECYLRARFGSGRVGRSLLAAFRSDGLIAAAGSAETFAGGYRGRIRLRAVQPDAAGKHLRWTQASVAAFTAFFAQLQAAARLTSATPPTQSTPALNYRWQHLVVKFVRSVGKRTPSAFALPWEFTYNVNGSLMQREVSVRETLFHEIFHMNDAAHDGWSRRVLGPHYDAIVKACGGDGINLPDTACLAPYAPNHTRVRKGTYYAFQPQNGDGVVEYAAELAVRYYREQQAALHGTRTTAPAFKCGPAENRLAWQALIAEFFGGIDLVPACPSVP